MTTYTAWGFDFAYGDGLTTDWLKSQGATFVCRYISTVGNTKNVSAAELENYHAAGINVVINYETTGLESGQAAGVAAANAAQSQLNTLAAASGIAQLKTAPVIFSLDTQPTASVIANAEAYMRGVVSVLGINRTGAYGGYAWIKDAFDKGIIAYGWQTYAWSNNQWDSRAQLQQYQNDAPSSNLDRDRATSTDFGQVRWDVAAPPTPTPPPPAKSNPTPAPAPVSAAKRNTFTPITVDGDFGPASIKAEQFVSFNGNKADCDGVFGPASKKSMQAHLGVSQDGVIGPVTVKALQHRVGASQDGIWGAQTTKALQTALNKGTY